MPEVLDIETVPGGGVDLEDDNASGMDDFAGVVDHRSS